MPPEDLVASVQRTQVETNRAAVSNDEDKEAYARKQKAWWYLLVVALIGSVAEIYVANRSYRLGGAV